MCILVDQEVDHAAADVLDICRDKVVADEADAACRTHFSQRLARADLAVYRDVHTAEVGMLAQRTAHNVVGELLIVAAVLGREQLESRELGLCLIAEAVNALAVRKVVFLTADHEHASLSREQEIHQAGARAAEGIVVRADVAQSARLRQVGVEGHDRDLGGQLHHPRAHTRILCRRQRQSVHAKLDQLVDRSQLALRVNALNGAHINLRAGRGQLRLRAHDLLENHVHEHGLDRLDDNADLDRIFREREQTALTVGAIAQLGCDAAHTVRDLRVNAAAIVEGAVDRAARYACKRGDFYQSNCHFSFSSSVFLRRAAGAALIGAG